MGLFDIFNISKIKAENEQLKQQVADLQSKNQDPNCTGILSKLFSKKQSDEYDSRASIYKMETLEQIESIPIPTKKFRYKCDFTQSIEYVLQRKATQFKKAGDMDLAIACLKKSNEIMPFAPMMYTDNEYGRLEKYLKLAGRFDEARQLKREIEDKLNQQHAEFEEKRKQTIEDLNSCIEVQRENRVCSECAKYHDRVYSPNHKYGYPDIKIFFDYYYSKTCDCVLSYHPFFPEIGNPMNSNKGDPVKYSNRPFEDDRTKEEKTAYNNYVNTINTEQKDRDDYDWLCEYLPDISPKSFGGYRKMKNSNSANYQKLVAIAKENGYNI